MNVVSLFNGMGCIWLALQEAGIEVNKRYSSEIDKHANFINDKNYPDTIQLGDVRNIKGSDLGHVDLLVGGSPCQGFSLNGKQLNFGDNRSSLFFEFVRILKELQAINPNIKYFLENVKMKEWCKEVISRELGVFPVQINSSLFTAQMRDRSYWANFGIDSKIVDRGILAKNIMDEIADERLYKTKSVQNKIYSCIPGGKDKLIAICELKNRNSIHYDLNEKGNSSIDQNIFFPHSKLPCIVKNSYRSKLKYFDGKGIRTISKKECERLQGVKEGYTDGVTENQAIEMLGNGWTIPVITHILKGLKTNKINQVKNYNLELF
jgi:site-specific DNA-cytosine methylase